MLKDLLIVIIPVIVTGLLGSGFLTNFLSGTDSKVVIALNSIDSNLNKATLQIINAGTSSVTDFSLILQTPNRITEVAKTSNSNPLMDVSVISDNRNITLLNSVAVNSSELEISIPNLFEGSGSVVGIDISFDSVENLADETANLYAVYDQGSSKGTVNPNPFLNLEYLYYTNFYLFLAVIIGLLGYTVAYPIVFFHFRRKRRKRKVMETKEKIVQCLLDIRSQLIGIQQMDSDTFNSSCYEDPQVETIAKGNYLLKMLFSDFGKYLLSFKVKELTSDKKSAICINLLNLIEKILLEIMTEGQKPIKKYQPSSKTT